MRTLLSCLLLVLNLQAFAIKEISITATDDVLENSISKQAIEDCQQLLKQIFNCEVSINNYKAEVQLRLPAISDSAMQAPTRFSQQFDYPYYFYPDHDYTWASRKSGVRTYVELTTASYQGIAFGLYGLLQEQLGVKFYHPKQTKMPSYYAWPLDAKFKWEAKAQFDKKGFHLHTQHPLELTEQLLNEDYPNAMRDVKQYLDWLVRNGQNYFEFNLLESIDLKEWPEFAAEFVAYGKSRGLIMGVDISLHMIQQKAYMLYKGFPASFRTKKNQIKRNLEWLFQADWDIVNMEFSTTEFSEGNMEKKEQQRLMIIDLVKNIYGAKLMGREHVVKKEEMAVGSKKDKSYKMNPGEKVLDSHRGILIHTVMFYTATEDHAPVYQNENLKHMMEKLEHEIQVRETWYYPESAYWITFDNSIPMLLLPYLSARLNDIDTMVAHNVPGHVTFSSGWEWGYWLIDWSIARWSWKHTYTDMDGNTRELRHEPTEYIGDVLNDNRIKGLFTKQLHLQDFYLKKKNLMQYMAPSNVTDEMPAPMDMEFQPRPNWKYRYMRHKADTSIIATIRATGVKPLEELGNKMLEIIQEDQTYIDGFLRDASQQDIDILTELINATKVTAYRALHKSNTLNYLLTKRESELYGYGKNDSIHLLERAINYRDRAQPLVTNAEENLYRYPVDLIARKRVGHTCYHFGYLYPVSNLHFWQREELQVRKDRYGPFYKMIWNIPRTVGLID